LLVAALQLARDARVLDIATGKGETLCRVAARYGAQCTGIERSPYFCEEARARVVQRGLESRVTIVQQDGSEFSASDSSFDAAMCIGAEWIFDGFEGTLRALSRWTRPGGTIVVGTPHWRQIPPDDFLVAEGYTRHQFASQEETVARATALGLNLVYMVASSVDDWDDYESRGWLAAHEYARDNPDDPDSAEVIERTERSRQAYFAHGRKCFGWATYVFRKP
jgi:ubiquinone/menaquinone biosynthesis C-methylase UbiE